MAQKEGFEPSRALYTPTPLAGVIFRPVFNEKADLLTTVLTVNCSRLSFATCWGILSWVMRNVNNTKLQHGDRKIFHCALTVCYFSSLLAFSSSTASDITLGMGRPIRPQFSMMLSNSFTQKAITMASLM